MIIDNNKLSGNHTTERSQGEISLIKRREIQAPLAVNLIKAFSSVIGEDRSIEIATKAIKEDARAAGKTLAEVYGNNTIKELSQIIREIWAEDGALVIKILEETEEKLSFDVTYCHYVEVYDKAGIKNFGYCLSCCRDEAFIQGFNADIKIQRTHSIMQGDAKCDFRFYK